MHAIAKALTPAMKEAAANSIEQLPPFPTTNTLGGNSAQGEDLFKNNCIDCHRYNASGELAFRSAPLTGLQDWYMVAQLIKFRDGLRGKIPGDEDGAKMHLQTGSMTDEQFRDVVAYIADLAQRYRSER
jgi:cytochrome c553